MKWFGRSEKKETIDDEAKHPAELKKDDEIISEKITSKPSTQKIETENKLKKDNVDFYVFHQASKIVLENLIRKLGISHKKTYINIEKYGNTVSSTIPIIISELMKKKLFKKNKKIILCGFGVGLSMGVSLIET